MLTFYLSGSFSLNLFNPNCTFFSFRINVTFLENQEAGYQFLDCLYWAPTCFFQKAGGRPMKHMQSLKDFKLKKVI